MSASQARAAPAQRLPLFGVEIEMYVKVRPRIEVLTREKQRTDPNSLPGWWRVWDFNLKNDPASRQGQIKVVFHRIDSVNNAVQQEIDTMLGPDNGWHCTSDPSMSERKLALPPDARKWWGVEIVSPPMSVGKQWQQELDMVYKAVSKTFEIYTTEFTGCHVHVSPGPVKSKEHGYKTHELVRMAKASFFWEDALRQYLPADRRDTEYARPNHKSFATEEYNAVRSQGWGPVFNKLDSVAAGEGGEDRFLEEIQGGEINGDRYTSFNFAAFKDIGTVEFRRQPGALSPITTGHRILLALGLHLSAMRYDFDGAKGRKTHPSAEELRKELAGCIKRLPETCHGSRFLYYLTWCYESYQGGKSFSEAQINVREQALRKGIAPPEQRSAVQPPRPDHVPGEGNPLPFDPEEYSSTDVDSSADEETPAAGASTGRTRRARGSRSARGGARASDAQSGQARGGARGRTPGAETTPRPTTTGGTARGGNAAQTTGRGGAAQGTGRGGAAQPTGRGGAAQGTGRGGPAQGTGRGGAAPTTGRGGAAQPTGRGGAAQGTGRGGAAPTTGRGGATQGTGTPARTSGGAPTPQASAGPRSPRSPTARNSGGGGGGSGGGGGGGGGRTSGNTQGGAGGGGASRPAAGASARTGGGTTRLAERPAAGASRPAASGNNGSNATASSSRNTTTGNSAGGTTGGGTRPRRRQDGDNA